jgi:outer membrane protein OmpA-like peptidoglycan-associated protein
VKRLEAEARIKEQFSRIEGTFQRDEARVYREANDIIIRLVGLTFASGQSNVEPNYLPLLSKVRNAVEVFPRSRIVIEGHTDSYGGDDSNMALSKRRAEAVGDYMTAQFSIEAFRIAADGFGETRPIANNETAEGRARNRRIDVVIKPQLD